MRWEGANIAQENTLRLRKGGHTQEERSCKVYRAHAAARC